MLRHTTLRTYYLLFHLWVISCATGNSPRTIIVGAGPAGIAAASKLFENGFENVTIIEAENRIGGRVYTTQFDNYSVDMGGQWVHGEVDNVAFELAWPLGLLERSFVEISNLIVHDSKGVPIPTDISHNLTQLYLDIAEKANEDLKGSNGSIGEYFMKEFNSHIEKDPSVSAAVSGKHFLDFYELMQNSQDSADTWYDTSARGYVEYWESAGDQAVIWKNGGYETILQILMKSYPHPEEELPVLNHTILNTEVATIYYNRPDNTTLIKTSSGDEYVADHVIITPSLGVLKERYGTLFVPELPGSKVKVIRGLSIGSVAKIYLSFEEPWWPEDTPGLTFVWNDEDKNQIQNDPDKKWLLNVFGFFTIPYKPRLLCGWMSGPGVRDMEKLPHDQVLNESVNLLNRFLGKSYNVTKPSGMLRSKWYSNKHFRGTYSYRSLESEKANVWADQLAEPLMIHDKPVVMFAGEATSTHHYSTVHGAIESGWREADRIIKMYRKEQ